MSFSLAREFGLKFESKDIWSTNHYWADSVPIEVLRLLG
ncbi:MAG: hypothetical protein ACI92G_002297 [Candidatus Pelagisphaera sp.]|jgi:hypothetical protein